MKSLMKQAMNINTNIGLCGAEIDPCFLTNKISDVYAAINNLVHDVDGTIDANLEQTKTILNTFIIGINVVSEGMGTVINKLGLYNDEMLDLKAFSENIILDETKCRPFCTGAITDQFPNPNNITIQQNRLAALAYAFVSDAKENLASMTQELVEKGIIPNGDFDLNALERIDDDYLYYGTKDVFQLLNQSLVDFKVFWAAPKGNFTYTAAQLNEFYKTILGSLRLLFELAVTLSKGFYDHGISKLKEFIDAGQIQEGGTNGIFAAAEYCAVTYTQYFCPLYSLSCLFVNIMDECLLPMLIKS